MSDLPASRMLRTLQSSSQPVTQQMLHSDQSNSQANNAQVSQSQSAVPPSNQVPAQQTVPAVTSSTISDQQKLDTFEAVLSEVEMEKAQATQAQSEPEDIQQDQAQQSEQSFPQQEQQPSPFTGSTQPTAYAPVSVHKEVAPTTAEVATELPGGMQQVESEPNPEIPEEVESYLQKVEEHTAQMPEEIVIAAEQSVHTTQQVLPQNVKVLPISKEEEQEAKKKNPSFSIRWLLAFSMKLAAMFKGKAVYRE